MTDFRFKVVLFAAYFMFGILLNSVGIVILQSIASFGVSKPVAGTLEGFKDLPIAIVSFLVASRLPAFGFKKALIIAFCLVTAACVIMAILPAFNTTRFLFLVIGASFALVKISVYAVIGLLTGSPNQHASLMNSIEGVFMIGVLSGYWIFSFFVDPAQSGSLVWVRVYWPLAALCLLIAAAFFFLRFPEAPKAPAGERAGTGNFTEMFVLAARPMVLVFLISAFLYVLIEQGIGTWLPTFNKEVLHLPADMSIQATSIFAVGLAAGRLTAGLITQRVDWYIVLAACVIAMGALVVAALPLAQNVVPNPDMIWANAPVAAFVFPLIGFFMGPVYPAINSVILSALPKAQHALMAGLIVVFSALGGTTGSYVTGIIFEYLGGTRAFYTSIIPMIGILVSITALKKMTARNVTE
ncbi:MAG: MFS transporter [Hyphomonadaceae bacterium]|nr:MFS transporter [Hyphomonadaceae bacterium]